MSIDKQTLPIKVRCKNWVESKKVQCALAEKFDASWGYGIKTPWQPKSKLLLVVMPMPKGNFFAWVTQDDYEICDFAGYEAKELLENIDKLEVV